jgi:hypothetical protein
MPRRRGSRTLMHHLSVGMAICEKSYNKLLVSTEPVPSADTAETGNVDEEYIAAPRRWDISNIFKFMVFSGPISSIFDYATYAMMLCVFDAWNNASLFQTGWFRRQSIHSPCADTRRAKASLTRTTSSKVAVNRRSIIGKNASPRLILARQCVGRELRFVVSHHANLTKVVSRPSAFARRRRRGARGPRVVGGGSMVN